MPGEIDVHSALTRGWALTGISGVPFGAQTDVPSRRTTGAPIDVTRTAPVVHSAVTQGGDTPDVIAGKVHPATVYGPGTVMIGIPSTVTLGLTAVGSANPA
jgi:hypothetical protein